MKIAILLLSTVTWIRSEALWCWTCSNARDNADCQRMGVLRSCLPNQDACLNEFRKSSSGLSLSKGCKQSDACSNNRLQNEKAAWHPTQCNTRGANSVCRCCCTTNGCNADERCISVYERAFDCPNLSAPRFGNKSCDYVLRENEIGSDCSFSCHEDYRMVGANRSICQIPRDSFSAQFSHPTPICVALPKDCTAIQPPQHGFMNCTNGVRPGSICTFGCDDFIIEDYDENEENENAGRSPLVIPSEHELTGEREIRCSAIGGHWSAPPPTCVAVTCPELLLPKNVQMTCTYGTYEGSTCSFSCPIGYEIAGSSSTFCLHVAAGGAWTNAVPTCKRIECSRYPSNPHKGWFSCTDRKYLNSECEFFCNRGYEAVGSKVTKCVDQKGVREWSNKIPTCERIVCESQTLTHGRINCTNGNNFDSVCTYECTEEGFALNPLRATSARCSENSQWSIRKPCCSRQCPPYSIVDLVFAIDSSSSIGEENWITIKSFVKSIIETFVINDEASRIGAFRYNRHVDTRTQILLRDHPNSQEDLLRAFDEIPFDGRGTYTGQALIHARNVMFAPGNGNRPDVPDYMIVITDGSSFDSISRGARLLRQAQVHVFAIGVVPQKGQLNFNQLRELVTHDDDLIVAESGFDDLNANLFNDLVEIVCRPGCDSNRFFNHRD